MAVVLNGNKMARTKGFNEEEVLDKAVQLFWTKGYNATSANDLVKELGLSRSSLYDTYGDKRTLFINSLKRYRETVVAEMLNMIDNSTNIKQTFKDIFRLIIEQDIEAKIPKGCFVVNSAIELSSNDNEIAEIVKLNQYEFERTLEKAILKGQKEGSISNTQNATYLAKFYYNSIVGIRVSMKYNKLRTSLDEITKINLSILEN